MMNYVHFQTQITSVMEIMTKSAIAEITKIFDHSSSVLSLKISRCLLENDALNKKLQTLQRELRVARGQKGGIARVPESPVNTRAGVGVQALVPEPDRESGFALELSVSLRRDGERGGVEQSVDMEEIRPEPVLMKQEESLEEGLCYRDPQPTPGGEEQVTQPTPGGEGQVTQPMPLTGEPVEDTPVEDGEKPDTEPAPAGDPEELSEQHRCEHGDEELSGLEFVVKTEQEEEHVAQRLDQTRCEHSTGRLNNRGSEYVIYERDSQLWTSLSQDDSDFEFDDPVCSNPTEQCSQSLSIHGQLQHTPATMEVSLSSFGASYVDEFDKLSEKSSACEELRSEAIHTQQGQYRERLAHTVERENQTLLPQQQQQHGPSVKHMRSRESPAQPHSGSQYETGSTLGTSAFSAGNEGDVDGQSDLGKKTFICVYCGKSFNCCSHLISHHRIHTGEKPYSCAQCGKCFSLKGNLVQHERVHSGNKPFGCAQCGKRFARGANLRAHQRSHTGERPYSCAQCGKRYTRQNNLLVHQRIHTKVKQYSFI